MSRLFVIFRTYNQKRVPLGLQIVGWSPERRNITHIIVIKICRCLITPALNSVSSKYEIHNYCWTTVSMYVCMYVCICMKTYPVNDIAVIVDQVLHSVRTFRLCSCSRTFNVPSTNKLFSIFNDFSLWSSFCSNSARLITHIISHQHITHSVWINCAPWWQWECESVIDSVELTYMVLAIRAQWKNGDVTKNTKWRMRRKRMK